MKRSVTLGIVGPQILFTMAMCCVVAIAADPPLDFSGQDLPGRNFRRHRLEKANFEEANLREALFEEAVVTGGNFQGADLSGANFSKADLTGADFRGARIATAILDRAILNGANLEKADLSRDVDGLMHVKLRKANLRNLKAISKVVNVDFSEADLRGANLVGLEMVAGPSRFRKAKYNSQTLWPKGFDLEAAGVVLVEDSEEEAEDKPKAVPDTKSLEKEFAALDANQDGRLSGKEMRGLEALDANKDGRVSLEEFIAGKRP
jgi:hypothetical protein